jgi:hypothetical protein
VAPFCLVRHTLRLARARAATAQAAALHPTDARSELACDAFRCGGCCTLLLYEALGPCGQIFELWSMNWCGAMGIRTPDLLHAISGQFAGYRGWPGNLRFAISPEKARCRRRLWSGLWSVRLSGPWCELGTGDAAMAGLGRSWTPCARAASHRCCWPWQGSEKHGRQAESGAGTCSYTAQRLIASKRRSAR